jgi:hypothetical protein
MTRLLCVCALFAAGCSSGGGSTGAGPDKADTLREVGGLVSSYTGEYRRGPQKVADLARYEAGYPLGYEAVKSGEITVVWGAKMVVEEGGGSTGTTDVVAYQKKVLAEGGLVLLQNGTVKEMSADEFRSAPKAK